MITVLIALMTSCSQDGPISGPQFVSLLRSQHSAIKDVSFVFEGKLSWIGPQGILKGDPERFGLEFQGTYLFRSDSAELLDVYVKELSNDSRLGHLKEALLGDRYETLRVTPDMKRPDRGPFIETRKGGPGSISEPSSPQQLLYLSFFRALPDPSAWGYEFEGWEDVDGQRCLKIRFRYGSDPNPPDFARFWIDIGRGGHALKVEHYRDSRLASRCRISELLRVTSPDHQAIWVPIRCESEGFQWGDTYYSSPVHLQTVSAVYASILLNVGLPDALFTVRGNGGLPDLDRLDNLRREGAGLALRLEFDKKPAPSLPRSDPAGVRKVLEEQLALAENQASILQASSPSRENISSTMLLQGGLIALGLSILIYAGWARRRR